MTTTTVTKRIGDLFYALLYGLARAEEGREPHPSGLFTAADLLGEDYFHVLLAEGFPKDFVLRQLGKLDDWPRYYQHIYSAEYEAFRRSRFRVVE